MTQITQDVMMNFNVLDQQISSFRNYCGVNKGRETSRPNQT